MLENDIPRAALAMIDLFDLDASRHAEFRAFELREDGEANRAKTWLKIRDAIDQLQPLDR